MKIFLACFLLCATLTSNCCGRKLHSENSIFDKSKRYSNSKYELQNRHLFKLNVYEPEKLPTDLGKNENVIHSTQSEPSDSKTLSVEVGDHVVNVKSVLDSKKLSSAPKTGGYNIVVNPKFRHVIEIINKGIKHQKESKDKDIKKFHEENPSLKTDNVEFEVGVNGKTLHPQTFSESNKHLNSNALTETDFLDREQFMKTVHAPHPNKVTEDYDEFVDANVEDSENSPWSSLDPEKSKTEDISHQNKFTITDDEDGTDREQFSVIDQEDATDHEKFAVADEQDVTDSEQFSVTDEDSIDRDQFAVTDEDSIDRDQFAVTDEDSIDRDQFAVTDEDSIDRDQFAVTDEDSIDRDQFAVTDEDSIDYEQFAVTDEDAIDYEQFAVTDEDSTDRDQFSVTDEDSIDRDQFAVTDEDFIDEQQFAVPNEEVVTDLQQFAVTEEEIVADREQFVVAEEEESVVQPQFAVTDHVAAMNHEQFAVTEFDDVDTNRSVKADGPDSDIEQHSRSFANSAFNSEFEGSGEQFSEIENSENEDGLKSGRLFGIFSRQNETAPTCKTPKGEAGHCRRMRQCLVSDALENFNNFLQHLCLIRGALVGMCCPDNPVVEITNPEENETESLSAEIKQPPEGCGLNHKTRIVGGSTAGPQEWTWMVALMRRNRFYCGGVIINNLYILTAAHCVMGIDVKDLTVRLGEYDFNTQSRHTEDISVAEIKRHAQFVTITFQHDIALLKLRRTITYSKFVGSICLPSTKARDYSDVNGTVVGWGTVSFGGQASPILRQVTVPVWRNKDCDRTYLLENISDSFMCAGSPERGEDACQGDSGGPLMATNEKGRWEVIGIVSWGRRCGDPTYPGVYTRVTTYLDWINQNIN